MTAPLPVTVIGGYLGAGKTTLVNHLLRHAAGRRLAVLVNEFGALPIDADLIEAQDDDLISIAGGCICCSFGSDLTAAMMQLAALRPRPDHVVIEASGVAMPGAIAASIGILDGFALSGVVVLADTETIRRQADDAYMGDTMLRQLRDADLIVQTKVDLVDSATLAAVSDWMTGLNAAASQVPATQGVVPPEVALGSFLTVRETSPAHHADAGFESVVHRFAAPQDPQALARRLATGGLGVVRAKGFVADRSGGVALIQIVGPRFDVTPFVGEVPQEMVFIGLAGQLDRDGLMRLASS